MNKIYLQQRFVNDKWATETETAGRHFILEDYMRMVLELERGLNLGVYAIQRVINRLSVNILSRLINLYNLWNLQNTDL